MDPGQRSGSPRSVSWHPPRRRRVRSTSCATSTASWPASTGRRSHDRSCRGSTTLAGELHDRRSTACVAGLFDDRGVSRQRDDYDDPRNSFLDECSSAGLGPADHAVGRRHRGRPAARCADRRRRAAGPLPRRRRRRHRPVRRPVPRRARLDRDGVRRLYRAGDRRAASPCDEPHLTPVDDTRRSSSACSTTSRRAAHAPSTTAQHVPWVLDCCSWFPSVGRSTPARHARAVRHVQLTASRPMIDPDIKRCLGQMMKGVEVVGAHHDGVARAYCSHWVSQVSFEEPIVMASVSPKHDTHPLIAAAGQFSVSILAGDQVDVGQYFSYPGRRFRHIADEYLDDVPGTSAAGRPQLRRLAALRDVRAEADGRPRAVLRPRRRGRPGPAAGAAAAVLAAGSAGGSPAIRAREPGVSVRDELLARLAAAGFDTRMPATVTTTTDDVGSCRMTEHGSTPCTMTVDRVDAHRPTSSSVDDLVDDLLERVPAEDAPTPVDFLGAQFDTGPGVGALPRGPRRPRAQPQAAEARSTSGSSPRARRTRCTATRSATACAARRSPCGAARSRRRATCARCSPARRSGASCSASRARAPTSPACRRAACRTATSGSSTARRCGPRWPTCRGGACSSCAPTRRPSSTPASPRSSSTCTRRPSRSRPLRQMTGEAEFNEVYFTDTRIPDAEMLGKPGDGWRVSLTTLMNERVSIGGSDPAEGLGHRSATLRQGLDRAARRSQGRRHARRGDEAVDPRRGAAPHQHPRQPEPQDGRSRARGLDRQDGVGRPEQGHLRQGRST